MELKRGMLVKSKAGRDKDCIYVIGDVRNEYVYLADGASKPPLPDEKEKQKTSSAYSESRDSVSRQRRKNQKSNQKFREQ